MVLAREEEMTKPAGSFFHRLQRRKHVDAKGKKTHQLAKTLSILQLISIGVGSTIGAGVYVLVGTVARTKSGPALTLAFLIAGLASALSAFCYAELASRCPSAGSAYHYAYICVGEGVAWLIGWALILEYTVGGSAVARGISPNLVLLFGGEDKLPSWLLQQEIPGTDIVVDPCAAILVVLVTLLLCAGVKESVMVQAMVTSANVCVLIFVIVVGSTIGFKTGWIGYQQVEGGFLPFGINGMIGGAATVFFAYIGFDTVASTAEEVKHPQRDLPLGIGIALSICGTLYMLVSAVIVGLVPYNEIDVDTPISSAFSRYGVQWAMYVVSAGAVTALSSTLMGSLLPQPRILMAMSRDGLIPSFFLHVSKKTAVPTLGTLTTGIVAMLLAFFLSVDELSGMVSVGTLLAFAVVGVSILILRYLPPEDAGFFPDYVTTPIYQSSPPNLLEDPSTASQDIDGEAYSHNLNFQYTQAPQEDEEEKIGSHDNVDLPGKTGSNRRLAAKACISTLSAGAVLIAIGSCANLLPSWLRWTLGVVGISAFSIGAIVLAFLEQDEGRHTFGKSGGFICPFVPWLPVTSILINVYLLADLGTSTWLRVGVWLLIGAAVYLLYGMKHSLLSEKITYRPSTDDDVVSQP